MLRYSCALSATTHVGQPRYASVLVNGRKRLRRFRRNYLLQDLRDDAGADRLTTLTDGETQPLFHRDRADQLHVNFDVVARHDHLSARRQLDRSRHVRRAEVKLRPVAFEERGMTASLLLRQHVHLGLEIRVRGDRAGLRQHLATLHVLTLRTTQQHAHVVARPTLIQQLAEHLNTGADGLYRVLQTDDLHLVVHLHNAALDTSGHHRATAGNREHVFHRHQERLLNLALGHRDVSVHLGYQLNQRRDTNLALVALERLQRRADDDRGVVAGEFVHPQQLTDFHLDQLQELLVVDHALLVHEHHDVRHTHLARQQNVLARLRHRAVRGRYHQNRPVHLRSTGDHVLHI